jgi:hypothetical protein
MLESTTPGPLSSPEVPQVVAGEATNTNPWISLLLGLFAGLVVIGGVGQWWWYTTKK